MPFIVLEGLDGCGGETQTKLLKDNLKRERIKIFRSPDYTTEIGKAIKAYLDEKLILGPETAFTLFASDTLLTSKKIKIERRDNLVIMDRYITSTICYQAARGFNFEKGLKFIELMDYQKPEAIIYLDIKAETSIKRKMKEKGKLDYHEKKLEYLKNVRKFYKKMAKMNVMCDWYIVDGERPIKVVAEDVLSIVQKFL